MGDEAETVAGLAQLYLGNILYALELAALALDEQNKRTDAAFYRGIARKLADAASAWELARVYRPTPLGVPSICEEMLLEIPGPVTAAPL